MASFSPCCLDLVASAERKRKMPAALHSNYCFEQTHVYPLTPRIRQPRYATLISSTSAKHNKKTTDPREAFEAVEHAGPSTLIGVRESGRVRPTPESSTAGLTRSCFATTSTESEGTRNLWKKTYEWETGREQGGPERYLYFWSDE